MAATSPFAEQAYLTAPESSKVFEPIQLKHAEALNKLAWDKGWCSKALYTPPTTPQPKTPAISSAKMLPGYISVPGEQYGTPPAISLRCINGQTEGQLQWQAGKCAHLTPTFSNYWTHDPPQRPNVIDLRLQPSSRSTSCYSPEYLTRHAAYTVDPVSEHGRPASPASTKSAPATSSRPASRPDRNPFVSSHLELSPPGQHRVEGYNEKVFRRLQATSRPVSPTTPLPARPHTSPVFSSVKAEARNRAVGEASRWGSRSIGPVCALQRSKAKERQRAASGSAAVYVNGYMQRSLPPSPMTDLVRSMAHSSFDTQGTQSPTLLTRAVSACRISRSKSMQSREGQAVAVGTCPRRDTHYPAPTEAQLRASRILTHDKRKYAF